MGSIMETGRTLRLLIRRRADWAFSLKLFRKKLYLAYQIHPISALSLHLSFCCDFHNKSLTQLLLINSVQRDIVLKIWYIRLFTQFCFNTEYIPVIKMTSRVCRMKNVGFVWSNANICIFLMRQAAQTRFGNLPKVLAHRCHFKEGGQVSSVHTYVLLPPIQQHRMVQI